MYLLSKEIGKERYEVALKDAGYDKMKPLGIGISY